jgi:molybdopterin molybdotransferase
MANHLHSEGFRDVTEIDDALQILMSAIGEPAIKVEGVSVGSTLGRILAADIVNDRSIPQVDRSTVDGYAVRSQDIIDASVANSVTLKIVGESRIGEVCKVVVKVGEAVAIATGSMVPAGADAVVMVEKTASLPRHRVAVHEAARQGQNILKKGEDVSPGTLVLKRGHRIRPQDVGIMLELGVKTIRVMKRPKAGIIATGDELVRSKKKRDIAKIVDVNTPILSAMVKEAGGTPIDLGIARDREDDILGKLRKGLRSCDLLLVSAGSSVGKRDLVPKCINAIGKPGMLIHGIAMRPSLPTGLAVVKGKPILSLPGFPVSAMFAFRIVGRPLIAKLLATQETLEPSVKAVLKEGISGTKGYRTFVRVLLSWHGDGMVAAPLKSQRSSELMSMVSANGIVTIPEGSESYEAGQMVDVTVIGEIPR